MREDIIHYLEAEVKKRCERESNFFGMGMYKHIQAVVEHVTELAPEYGADTETVVLAAWLHDIATITDYQLYEEHHLHGARIAEEILSSFRYDRQKLELVKQCIRNHRGSKLMQKHFPEEICIADAEAAAHFSAVPSLLYFAYVNRGLGLEEGTRFVREKLERSYHKLSTKGKERFKDKYEQSLSFLS